HAPSANTGEIPELATLATDLSQGSAEQVLSALKAVNRLAAAHPLHPALVGAAAQGSVWLVVQTYDQLQLSDALVGHAVALVALSKALDLARTRSDEALLLRTMGYEAAAAEAAKTLPAGDAVGPYARFDAKGLATMAADKGAARAQYLELLDLAKRDRGPGRWWEAFGKSRWSRSVDLASLRAIAELADFPSIKQTAAALTAAAFLQTAAPPDAARGPSAELWGPEAWPSQPLSQFLEGAEARITPSPLARTRAFEEAAARHAVSDDGPLFDGQSLRAFQRATFYSGIHESAVFLFDFFGSNPDAEAFAKKIEDPAPGTAAELKAWMLARVAVRTGGPHGPMIEELGNWRHVGVVPLQRVISFLAWTGESGTDPSNRRMLRDVAWALDSRPANVIAAMAFARSPLNDVPRIERLQQSLGDSAPYTNDAAVRHAGRVGDVHALEAFAADSKQSTSTRLLALILLRGKEGADPSFARARYAALMKENPEDTSILATQVQELRNAKQPAAARDAVTAWLARRPSDDHGLPWAYVLTLKAGTFADEKKWKQAWETIRPAIPVYSSGVLTEGAWYLEEEGDWDEAMKLVKAARDRYPDDHVPYAIMARLLWRQQKFAEAAALLAGTRVLNRSLWEGDLARSFGHVFAGADPHLGQSAFAALQERKIDPVYLAALAKDVGSRGNHKLAFAMLANLPAANEATKAAIQIWAYDELAKADGETAAAEWLRKGTRHPSQLALVAFQFERYDIVWQPLEDPTMTKKTDEMQLLRAAALVYTKEPADSPRRAELVRYFDGRPSSVWKSMGLFLLGKLTPDELDRQTRGTDFTLASRGWVMGLRAAEEGRYS
ncbi:MAG TPA: tetratricopeptide repeat protein, partial [Thermoanaerobaculia bacterium]|nr:tetratricopeptide repeat protein [Thermoanaerobaculia bacterium]